MDQEARLRKFVDNLFFQLFIVAVIVTDVTVGFIYEDEEKAWIIYTILSIYGIEIALRIAAYGLLGYFKDWFNCLDFAIVVVSAILVFVFNGYTSWGNALRTVR